LYLVLDAYVYTWAIGSNTRLEHYRICRYRELHSQSDQMYTWYLPYFTSYCDPYVVYEVPDDRSDNGGGGRN
jgi:hypothetical protein